MPTRDATAPPRRRDGAATRERLMRAALELFTTLGYHASTTPVIASKAGIAEGTIYRHFPSKQQLLNDVYRGAVGTFMRLVREIPRDTPVRSRLERVAAAWRDLAVREPSAVRLVFVARLRNLLDQRSRDAWAELKSELETFIATGKAAGHVRPGPVDLWADIWLQMVALMLERVAAKEWAPDQASVAQLVDSAWIVMKADG